ncbi:DUF3500 domain-containing protein [Actinoplanes sp. NPDC051633]|uniref:DUF3500 domain-containing protein n=1 Tax=Actinoplanes sp. NPDC051633 TaxID=3155670 RepID=UPI00342D0C99
MAEAARALVHGLEPEQLRMLGGRLDDPQWHEWTYLPGDRPGLPLADMSDDQRECALELLGSAHGPLGAQLATGVLQVERVRRELVTGAPVANDRYWFRVLGEPGGDAPWGWRVNGHHLGVHVVVAHGRMSVTPHFIGAEPAELPSGRRLLGPDEDIARDLLTGLDSGRRRVAVFSATPPDDILTRADPVADPRLLPEGLRYGDMTEPQQGVLRLLVRRYLDRAPAEYADQCWAETVEAGLDRIGFAWAGGAERGARHYYCVSAPNFLIEYDNTQDEGNHAHSVWRHLRDDFGADLLRLHYGTRHAAPPG